MQTELETLWFLKQVNIFKHMTESDLRYLDRMTHTKTYRRHEQIYGQDDAGEVVYLLKEGRVKIYKLSPDDKALTLELLEPGEIFGEMAPIDDTPRDTTAETLNDSTLRIMRCRDFEIFLKRKPELAMRITKLIGMRRRHIENRLENLVFRSASSRLALLLLSLAEIHGSRDSRGIILNIKFSQQELANLIGIARETTSGLLNEFKRLGFIDIQRRRIKLLQSWRLKKIADATMTDLLLPEEPEPTEPAQ